MPDVALKASDLSSQESGWLLGPNCTASHLSWTRQTRQVWGCRAINLPQRGHSLYVSLCRIATIIQQSQRVVETALPFLSILLKSQRLLRPLRLSHHVDLQLFLDWEQEKKFLWPHSCRESEDKADGCCFSSRHKGKHSSDTPPQHKIKANPLLLESFVSASPTARGWSKNPGGYKRRIPTEPLQKPQLLPPLLLPP